MEFHLKYRPRTWSKVIGQPDAIVMLADMVHREAVKHCMMFTGPSGCGKTTLARILTNKLHSHRTDRKEFDLLDFRGIDFVRSLKRSIAFKPIDDCITIIIDEAHMLTHDAQQGFLKILEETPRHVYFFLCTTDPQKLATTIRTRATEIKTRELSPKETAAAIINVCKEERFQVSDDVMDALVEAADGSARKALVILDQIHRLPSKKQLQAIIAADSKAQASKIFSMLIGYKPKWEDMAKVLKLVGDEPERIRQYIHAAAGNVMLSGSKASGKANKIIQTFSDPFYDSKVVARSMLFSACFEICNG